MKKLNRLALQAGWILSGLGEGMILTGQQMPEAIAGFHLHHGVKTVIAKTGIDGVWYKATSGEQGCVASVKVDSVIDTVGVGDGFVVGVTSTLLEGRSLYQAATRSNRIGALAIQAQGDNEGLSTREQLGG